MFRMVPGHAVNALLGALLLTAFAIAFGCSDDPATDDYVPAQGGAPGSNDPVYDEAEAIAACESACTAYGSACAVDCNPSCDASTRLASAQVCPGEFYDYYDCIAATSADGFACAAGDTTNDNPVTSCASLWTTYAQCRRTRGYECATLAHDNASCLQVTGNPDWVTCKVDITPPDGCLPFNATDYCCP